MAEKSPAPELTFRELLRWSWRQLTSMRTALVLLFLLALAAVPGSVIPQEDVDAFKVSQWREQHPTLAPIYDWLGLFSVFDSVWFSAIYLLLVVSLVGCIVPRTRVYAKALRARPPAAPRNLSRLGDHATYTTDEAPDVVLARAAQVLRKRRFRVVPAGDGDAVSSERGYLREAGNLLFHLSVLVVLAGFAIGSLWGFKGGVIVVVGDEGFSNTLTQYDDFVPGAFTQAEDLDDFHLAVEKFDIEWLRSGPRKGMARSFAAHVRYTEDDGTEQTYRLRVNHPLKIADTDIFLVGHGYAPIITVRDGNGDVAISGPAIFLPEDQATFTSFGVVKVPDAQPKQIGLEGLLFPTYLKIDGDPYSVFPDDGNPVVSLSVYAGNLGMNSGPSQSVYALDKDRLEQVMQADGKPLRLDLQLCRSEDRADCTSDVATLPDGLGTVEFEGVQEWVRIQISKTPGTGIALTGVILALIGLLGSLFIRPRRVWVRARREGGTTYVEVAGLDRSSGGDVAAELAEVVAALQSGSVSAPGVPPKPEEKA